VSGLEARNATPMGISRPESAGAALRLRSFARQTLWGRRGLCDATEGGALKASTGPRR
jgi:hypothetical protein